jgi:hypothetical protein
VPDTPWHTTLASIETLHAAMRAESEALFAPSTRMRAFRVIVEACIGTDLILEHQWLKEGARRVADDPAWWAAEMGSNAKSPIGLAEFRSWHKLSGFAGWFYENVPEMAPISEGEKLRTNRLWLEKVVAGMQTGQPWALAEWRALAVAEMKATKDASPTTGAADLDDFIANATEEGWTAEA